MCRISGHLVASCQLWPNQRHFPHALWNSNTVTIRLIACVPLAVLSIDCFPDPRRECTPGTHDGTSLSRIGPICLQIRSKWSGAICLLAATCRGKRNGVKWQENRLLAWNQPFSTSRLKKRDRCKRTNLQCNTFGCVQIWWHNDVQSVWSTKWHHKVRCPTTFYAHVKICRSVCTK